MTFYERIIKFLQRNFPDPFQFALGLTFFAFLLTLAFTEKSADEIIFIWLGKWADEKVSGNGIFSLLEFSMQMCLILFSGYMIASSRVLKNLIKKLSILPKSTPQACVFLSTFSAVLSLINWGLCISASSILAREIIRSNPKVSKGAVASAAYCGLMIWHGGLSGSAPLDVATKGISLAETLFSPMNLFITLSLVVFTPIFFYFIGKISDRVEFGSELYVERDPLGEEYRETKSSLFDRFFMLLFIFVLIFSVFKGFSQKGVLFLNLYSVSFIFIMLALILHGSIKTFVAYVPEAIKPCGGIVVQFPFYAGVMSIITESGLGEKISVFISESVKNFPVFQKEIFGIITFVSASFLNIFIPSGGGQWKVQGPIMLQAGLELGVPESKTAMLVAYGDELTNMIQPFWMIPLIGITGIKAGYVVSYSFVYMLLSLPIYIAGIIFGL
ncbi:MAG: TIGR00366 family protein [Candidatus Calescibacterium sp.]|nr:TIGR00366 family protein [Candidatus Calescibacterium sp.]MCX7734401.1 TIGR00366 family protein [bacterium]MDW8086835.1 TIGR00366 family protein [Candidatus Calescibacterium sp.]